MSVSESRTAEIRVLIADDHAAVRSAVRRVLDDQPAAGRVAVRPRRGRVGHRGPG